MCLVGSQGWAWAWCFIEETRTIVRRFSTFWKCAQEMRLLFSGIERSFVAEWSIVENESGGFFFLEGISALGGRFSTLFRK